MQFSADTLSATLYVQEVLTAHGSMQALQNMIN